MLESAIYENRIIWYKIKRKNNNNIYIHVIPF